MTKESLNSKIESLIHPTKYECPARDEKGNCYSFGKVCPYKMIVDPNCEERAVIYLNISYMVERSKSLKNGGKN